MIYNINRRKFLELFSYGCCGIVITWLAQKCQSQIDEQLTLFSEARINGQAAQEHTQNSKIKAKLIT